MTAMTSPQSISLRRYGIAIVILWTALAIPLAPAGPVTFTDVTASAGITFNLAQW